MGLPKVSVVIPVFNAEKYIDETIQSVLKQTLEDWELLLVDDGSKDQSARIARGYAASEPDRIKYFEHDNHANLGPFAARIHGAKLARADVVALLDADDVWEAEYLEEHLRIWGCLQSRDVAVSYGPALYWFPDDSTASMDYVQPMPANAPHVYRPGELLESFLCTNYADTPCPSSALIRREIFGSVKKFEKVARQSRAFEDQILWWYIAARWPVAVHSNVWVRYRQHQSSSVRTMDTQLATHAELVFLETITRDMANAASDHPLVTRETLATRIRGLQKQRRFAKHVRQLLALLPAPVYKQAARLYRAVTSPRQSLRRLAHQLSALAETARARVRLGIGVEPLSEVWGGDRGEAICRYYLDQFLRECAADIRGHCLEFHDDVYTKAFGGSVVSRSDILHIDSSNPKATLIADLTKPNDLRSEVFDCIICTHVLHVIADLHKVVEELHRILKPGGVLLVGVPHISMCDPQWHELWRFTAEGLETVLARVFGPEHVSVKAYGNSLTAAGQIRGLATHEFTKAELDFHDLRFAVEICARAIKPY